MTDAQDDMPPRVPADASTGDRVRVQLVGIADLEDRWGYTGPGVHKVTKEEGFPEPYAIINRGRQKVWQLADVEAFEAADGRFGGEKRRAGPSRSGKGKKEPAAPARPDGSAAPSVRSMNPSSASTGSLVASNGAPNQSSAGRAKRSAKFSLIPQSRRREIGPNDRPGEGACRDGMMFVGGRWINIDVYEDELYERQVAALARRERELSERATDAHDHVLCYRFERTPPAARRDDLKRQGWRYDRARDEWKARVLGRDADDWKAHVERMGGALVYDRVMSERRPMWGNEDFDSITEGELNAID